MNTLELKEIKDRAETQVQRVAEDKLAKTWSWFYAKDVPRLLDEIEQLKSERNRLLWEKR